MKLTTILYGCDIIRYTIQTFGCKVNQYESASVAKAMEEHGYEKTDDIFTADIIIIKQLFGNGKQRQESQTADK